MYAGPLFEGPGEDAGWRPPPGDAPLVAVSVGTAGDPAGEASLLERIVTALRRLPVRAVVTLPAYLEPGALPATENVVLCGYVRHSALLPHARLLVTHAGLGSVVAGLAHGVPMVCLPLAREQPDNARAVARLGAGTVLDPRAQPETIASAVEQALATAAPVKIEPDPGPAVAAVEALATGGPR